MSAALEFRSVDILFAQDKTAQRNLAAAGEALRGGASRADVVTRLGVIAGVLNASLSVQAGQISVLVGLSGSGKSTLLRAANGLNRVSNGDVLLQDGATSVNVAKCDKRTLRALRRRRIAMVFQQFGLLPWRSVRANVGLGLELRGESRARQQQIVDEKLELVGLTPWAERSVGELSGGMQQRVGLARAFATDADVLLMDEPFSALDPLIRSRLQDELLSLQARVHKTIVFVTHDMNEALRLGNQISILDGGRIVQTGTATDIVTRPSNDYVAAFVQHINPLLVLTAAMVMQPLVQLQQEAGAGAGAVRLDDPRLVRVPGECTLQTLVGIHHASGLPVLVSDATGLIGVCGSAEIMAALNRHHRQPAGGHPPEPG